MSQFPEHWCQLQRACNVVNHQRITPWKKVTAILHCCLGNRIKSVISHYTSTQRSLTCSSVYWKASVLQLLYWFCQNLIYRIYVGCKYGNNNKVFMFFTSSQKACNAYRGKYSVTLAIFLCTWNLPRSQLKRKLNMGGTKKKYFLPCHRWVTRYYTSIVSESWIKTSQGHQKVTHFIKTKILLRFQVFYDKIQL